MMSAINFLASAVVILEKIVERISYFVKIYQHYTTFNIESNCYSFIK